MELQSHVKVLQLDYIRALRCWRSNNLRYCLSICDNLTKHFDGLNEKDATECSKLKQLVRFLKIRCLADEYYTNESLLLHEDDIEASGDQVVRVYSGARVMSSRAGGTTRTRTVATRGSVSTTSRKTSLGHESIMESRVRTGILTGRAPSAVSRQGSQGRAISSYRPLTTSLTASQTAFSRSTRPLLKYSTNSYMAKLVYEYLYNAQVATNKCPDYRQCLEYINLVQSSRRKLSRFQYTVRSKVMAGKSDTNPPASLVNLDEDKRSDPKTLGVYWLMSLAICYYNLHMHKQAEEYFQSALALDGKFLDCYTWLVKVYLRTNQPANVLKTCRLGLANSKSPLLYNWMARIQSLLGDLYAANSSLRSSLSFYPTNLEALANVGYFAFYGDKLEQSLKCFERIHQLTYNQTASHDQDLGSSGGSTAQLLNNLATCYFYNGDYHKVLPLFSKAFLSSPSKEVTSDIWYNISFVPLSFGFKNLAIACLRLALKNNSQNEEAINNLGVLKFGPLINDSFDLHFENRQEVWGSPPGQSYGSEVELRNATDQKRIKSLYDEAESHFRPPMGDMGPHEDKQPNAELDVVLSQPEMMYNMALLKRVKGELLQAVSYGSMYLDRDPNNYSMRNLLKEINQLVAHDA